MPRRLVLGLPLLLLLAAIVWTLKPWVYQAYLRFDYLLSQNSPTTVIRPEPVSPLAIDASKNNSYFYRPSGQESFYQRGRHQIIITSDSTKVLETKSFETQIDYHDNTLEWMRLFLTESPVIEAQLPAKIEHWFHHDSEIKSYILARLAAFSGKGKHPSMLLRHTYEIDFFSGCNDIENPQDDFAKGCMPRLLISQKKPQINKVTNPNQ